MTQTASVTTPLPAYPPCLKCGQRFVPTRLVIHWRYRTAHSTGEGCAAGGWHVSDLLPPAGPHAR